ncbi:MAG: hypothetical protein AAFQ80_23540 [Cyanobacteria bacterium J06621_8]
MNTKLIDSLVQIINSLTPEERLTLEQQLQDRTLPMEMEQSNLEDESFVGMWQDREDMENSSQWVRLVRQQEWSSEVK